MFGVELNKLFIILLQCTNESVEGLRLVAQFCRLSPLRFQLLRQILPQFHISVQFVVSARYPQLQLCTPIRNLKLVAFYLQVQLFVTCLLQLAI